MLRLLAGEGVGVDDFAGCCIRSKKVMRLELGDDLASFVKRKTDLIADLRQER